MANSSGRGEAGTIVWAVAAVIVVALFVVWLSMTAEPSVTPLLAEDDTAAAGPGGAAAPVTAADFEPNADSYRGQTIELQNVPVVQHMGRTIVWVELPSGSPFLVKVNDAVAANGLPTPQSRVHVVGIVREKSSALLQQWQDSGVLENAGQRTQAEFGSSYIEATAIRPAG